MGWLDSGDERQSIYVLHGVAGIGKSTVAKSIAERAAKNHTLGASFFFSRNEKRRRTAKSFFPTLAYQLARYHQAFAVHIDKALEEDPGAAKRGLRQQFYPLIVTPLLPSMKMGGTILIIIDALDECDDEGADEILAILAQEIPQLRRLKVLVTARPERHIRIALKQYRNHEQFCLQDIEDSVVEADIRLYLNARLSESEVERRLPELPPLPWQPTEQQKAMLIGISGKLFIIASTVVDFILDTKRLDPDAQLAKLLDGVSLENFSGSTQTTVLDHMYVRIIHAAQPDPVGDWVEWFQHIVGTIVLLQDPLPCNSLAALLGIDAAVINRTLSNLHSLLAPSGEDLVIRVHHKSFPDFMADARRCRMRPQFYIDRRMHHLRIAKRCLSIVNDLLHPNLCGLTPSEWYKDRAMLSDRAKNCIAPHVGYACIYWAPHFAAGIDHGPGLDTEAMLLLECFTSKHILNWLEALSIVGRVDVAYSSLDMVCELKVHKFDDRRE